MQATMRPTLQERNRAPWSTPWGQADEVTEKVPGKVWLVSTPRHGGFYVSPGARAEMPSALRAVTPFVARGGGSRTWYEEDCDANLVVLAFPDAFDAQSVWYAFGALRWDPQWVRIGLIEAFERMNPASFHRARSTALAFSREHEHHWLLGSHGSCRGRWWAAFTRIGDGERAERVLTTEEFNDMPYRKPIETLPGVQPTGRG